MSKRIGLNITLVILVTTTSSLGKSREVKIYLKDENCKIVSSPESATKVEVAAGSLKIWSCTLNLENNLAKCSMHGKNRTVLKNIGDFDTAKLTESSFIFKSKTYEMIFLLDLENADFRFSSTELDQNNKVILNRSCKGRIVSKKDFEGTNEILVSPKPALFVNSSKDGTHQKITLNKIQERK